METVLVIDSNAVGHRAKHSMHGLSYDEMETGVIFGFMEVVLRLAKQFETNKFAFAWDSKKNLRKDMYKEYKYKRRSKEKTPEEKYLDDISYKQFLQLRKEVLPLFGFENIFLYSGFEADDVIANIVINNSHKYKMVIVSSDEDLYQLLKYADMYSLKKKEIITEKKFVKEYGISVDDWVDVKAIAGCGSDNVKGVMGVGEKTAIKYLRNELKKGKALKSIKDSDSIIERNRFLVKLPLFKMEEYMDVKLKFRKERFLLDDFHKMCDMYGFFSFKKETNDWYKTFRME